MVDIKDHMQDESALADALAVAKGSKIAWVEQQRKLVQADKQYVFTSTEAK